MQLILSSIFQVVHVPGSLNIQEMEQSFGFLSVNSS